MGFAELLTAGLVLKGYESKYEVQIVIAGKSTTLPELGD